MYDMHIHIIPEIDDGAKDLETTIAMLKIAAQNGTTKIVATPHVIEGNWLPDWDTILAGCKKVKNAADELGIKMDIYPGGEVAMHMDILEHIKGPGPYCINGGRYLLVELPAAEVPDYAEDFFFILQTRGITPIIAHPERHPILAKDPNKLADWINKGILTQMNFSSLIGKMGERAMKTAELFIANNMIYIAGSDAHSTRTRNPDMTQGISRLQSLIGSERTNNIINVNPKAIVDNQDVFINEIAKVQMKDKSNLLNKILSVFK
ncbi:tyrosine-protein phosphatase [Dendrosporobacter sp. 1207_IL3150]|uniref:tyrosine-protein phosphatase n=1 Tax=Dendrosporobacter sp. 1207_IL3150 TaxID=3084054 RepID=UPI002FD9B34A